MTSVSVVIPCFNKWHLTHQLLFDLYKNCSLIEEVIVVDNGSTEKEVKDGLAWWTSTNMLPIETITIKDNAGFLRAANIGLKAAVGDFVWLISNDVRVYEDIVKYPSIGVADDDLVGGRLLDWDTGWNFGHPYLEGWILGTWNTVWNELNYFDELYVPCDMEDVDLSMTATSKGISILNVLPDGYVEHLGAQTIRYGTEREQNTIKNKEKFRQKWSIK